MKSDNDDFSEASKHFYKNLSDEEKKRVLKYVKHYKEAIGKTVLTQWKNPEKDVWIFDISREWLEERLNNIRIMAENGDETGIVRQYYRDRNKLPE